MSEYDTETVLTHYYRCLATVCAKQAWESAKSQAQSARWSNQVQQLVLLCVQTFIMIGLVDETPRPPHRLNDQAFVDFLLLQVKFKALTFRWITVIKPIEISSNKIGQAD
ncbi:hypothetical protein J6590_058261 [Homalodisca vitripennis]|nr:hypothetical protein J6590_058261 [Homalodisca vitripennis]